MLHHCLRNSSSCQRLRVQSSFTLLSSSTISRSRKVSSIALTLPRSSYSRTRIHHKPSVSPRTLPSILPSFGSVSSIFHLSPSPPLSTLSWISGSLSSSSSFSTVASTVSTSNDVLPSSLQYRLQLFEQEWQKYQLTIQREQQYPSLLLSPVEIQIISPFTSTFVATLFVSSKGWRPVDYLKTLLPPTDKELTKDLDTNPIVGVRWNKSILRGLTDPLSVILFSSSSSSSITSSDSPSLESKHPYQLEYVRLLDHNNDGKRIYWHSAAHVLGSTLENTLGNRVQLCDGPPIIDAEGGFFYEFYLQENSTTTPSNTLPMDTIAKDNIRTVARITHDIFPFFETVCRTVISNKVPFDRLPVNRQLAIEMFKDNPFKLDILYKLSENEEITLYRCGNFIDLCRGPHVPHTGYLKAMQFYRTAGTRYPLVDESITPPSTKSPDRSLYPLPRGNEQLHRIYGITFPTNQQLQQWRTMIDEAKRRDHRIIGTQQKLFFFHDASPGSTFFLPHGTRIYNRLVEILRTEYRLRGYEEVQSPLIYKQELWKTSGHLQAYAENMFTVTPGMTTKSTVPLPSARGTESCQHSEHHPHHHNSPTVPSGTKTKEGNNETDDDHSLMGLKPMNCPGHCLIFAHRQYSYRELPVRLADFSSLHRNEATGALGGLTRLRRFAQDDAHIFCGEEHITQEVVNCLDFVANIYRIFNFSFRMRLSTRPDVYVGDLATWNHAETALRTALESFLLQMQETLPDTAAVPGAGSSSKSVTVDIDQGGGAFYGPKVDVFVKDAIGREHQCATVQLDFQLPKRFDLQYRSPTEEYRTPVIIHRAILGSLERMLGILIEHTAGKWPFWLSPRQIILCTVADRFIPFAKSVADQLQFQRIESIPSATGKPTKDTTSATSASLSSSCIDSGLWIEIDDSNRTVPKKIREGQLEMWNILAVVGEQEETNHTLALRFRDATTYQSFIHVWKLVDSHRADEYIREQQTKNINNKGTVEKPKKIKGSTDTIVSKDENHYNSPFISLPIDTVKRICERMVHLRV